MSNPPEIKQYVLGFLFGNPFTREHSEVVLIRKEKPENQRGKLNGVGGKIEPGETPNQAMVREYLEEAGVQTGILLWRKVGRMIFPDCIVHVFSGFDNEVVRCSRTETAEPIVKVTIADLEFHPRMLNLDWLIPLCQSAINFPFSNHTPWIPLDITENFS